LLLLDGQVHHDTHPIPMGNYVIEVGNYVIVSPSKLGNYVSADTGSGHGPRSAFPSLRRLLFATIAADDGSSKPGRVADG